jgi:hypothetical protein
MMATCLRGGGDADIACEAWFISGTGFDSDAFNGGPMERAQGMRIQVHCYAQKCNFNGSG